MAKFTREYLHDYCEGLDAAMFSGDAFMEKANRERLLYYMARWQRQLKVWEEIEAECATEGKADE